MALRLLTTPPKLEDYIPLKEYEEQTPATFSSRKPVLHAHYTACTLSIPTDKLQVDPATAKFAATSEEQDSLIKNVDVFVSSDDLIFFQTAPTPTGVSIPYPSIALHATMKYRESATEALYMNIYLTDLNTVNDDDDIVMLDISVLPPNYPSSTDSDNATIKAIFSAMNVCADLHPDPDDSDAEEPEVDDTAPGASGWITAENMHEFVDEEGNLRADIPVFGEAQAELGPGAGTVRPRDEDGEQAGLNGVDGTDETKWQRTG